MGVDVDVGEDVDAEFLDVNCERGKDGGDTFKGGRDEGRFL